MADVTILQMPLFKQAYKKLKRNQQEATDQAVAAIVDNPALGEQKRGDLIRFSGLPGFVICQASPL